MKYIASVSFGKDSLHRVKLLSLFDGSGGFPLAASMCGITPVMASEVEPYPIAVTTSRFPNMKHLGNVSEINGAEIEPVDIITFGSPCQDLSVAGKRAGLKHEDNGDDETTRSGLFMEAVRIIKEMREATNGVYPTFAVWENVPGAFSSNKGRDFRIVLEELIRICEPTAAMPTVPRAGWNYADCFSGSRWSLAYRVFDAQYWGVPQRRRRIYLVLDLRGERAGEILFKRQGLRGYFEKGRAPWQAIAGNAENRPAPDDREGIGLDIYNCAVTGEVAASLTTATGQGASNTGPTVAVPYTLKIRSGCEGGGKGALIQTDKSATLSTLNDQYLFQPVAYSLDAVSSNSMKSSNPYSGCRQTEVSRTLDCFDPSPAKNQGGIAIVEQHKTDGNNQPFVLSTLPIHDQATRYSGQHGEKQDGKGNGFGVGNPGDPMNTLTAGDRHAVAYAMQAFGKYTESETASAMKARDYKDATDLVTEIQPIAIDRAYFNQGQNALYDPKFYEDGTNPTLVAKGPNAVAVRYIVRRITPTECARLQGFPDTWGHPDRKETLTDEEYQFWQDVRNTHAEINGKAVKEYTMEQILKWYNKLHTDSAEYKMWGNGIALPNALYVMQGIADVLNKH